MKIGIVGNGFVGNSLYEGMKNHYDCAVYDIDPSRSHSTLEEITMCHFIFLCVPTPMKDDNSINLSYINGAISSLVDAGLTQENVLVIKSTVTPGTCKQIQEATGNVVLSNPEFLTERFAHEDFLNPRCIVIGGDETESVALQDVYTKRFAGNEFLSVKYFLTDSTTSELIKYAANCFFSVKITFANELKQICDASGGDWKDLIDGLITEGRVFPQHLDVPGHDGRLGFGGNCFPKDMNALIAHAKLHGVDPVLLQAALQKNDQIR